MSSNEHDHHRTGDLYGSLAYAMVVVSSFAGYFFYNARFFASETMVPVTFVLGAVYAVLGVVSSNLFDCRKPLTATGYYLVQCAILTAIVLLSPIRGFFGIIVLPLVAQSIFDLRPRWAAVITFYLFAVNILIWWIPFGWGSGVQAAISYSAGFVFTVLFSIITKQALAAREHAEKLRLEVETANELLRANAAQAEDLATTRERNRLAREIHDGVGHYLTVIKTQLDAAAALIGTRPDEARASVLKAAKLTGDALDDVRRSVGALRTDAARPPLPEALRTLTAESGLPVTVRLEGAARPLPPGTEHALFRSAQEALTNIRKHAAASGAEVLLDFRAPGRVTLAITDNGHGAKGVATGGDECPAGMQGAVGFGLRGIAERIEVIGGRVESGNRPAGGFALTIEVPA